MNYCWDGQDANENDEYESNDPYVVGLLLDKLLQG